MYAHQHEETSKVQQLVGKGGGGEQNQQPNATYEKEKVHKNAYSAIVPAKQDSVMKCKHRPHGGGCNEKWR